MPKFYPPPTRIAASTGIVDRDLSCRQCGYNLRGLRMDGRCPECAANIALSAAGSLFQYSHPEWIWTLRRAVIVLMVAVALRMISFIVYFTLLVTDRAIALEELALTTVLCNVIALISAWMLTTRDPGRDGEKEHQALRTTIRIAAIITIFGSTDQIARMSWIVAPQVRITLAIISIATGIAALIGVFSKFHYMQKLLRHIPDIKLVARLGALKYIYLVYDICSVMLLIIMAVNRRSLVRIAGLIILLYLARVVLEIACLIILAKVASRFTSQAKLSEQHWTGQIERAL